MAELGFEEEVFEEKFNGQTLLQVVKLALKHWPLVLGFLSAISLCALMEAFGPLIMKRLIDLGVSAGNRQVIISSVLMYTGMNLGVAACVFTFIYCAALLGETLQFDIRKKLFEHLQELSFSYFDRTPVGWIMSRLTSDTGRISDLATWHLLDLTWGSMHIITAVIFMFTLNAGLAAIVLATLPLMLFIAVKFKTKIIAEYRKVRSINSRITGAYNENISGVRVVKALVREERNFHHFDNLTGEMYSASFRAAWLSAMFLPVIQIITAVTLSLIIWRGGGEIQVGGLSLGGLQAFIGYITFIMWPIQDVARVYAEMQRCIASAERIFSLLDTDPDIVDRPGAEDPKEILGEIVFDHVTFYYEEDNPVLSDFCLTVKPGETIALVGPTGGGKSTIVNLACRFYEPRSGRILIDGKDYTGYTLQGLQSRLGVVLQTPHLFSGSVMDNLRYGRLDASDEEVIEAAKLAHADEFIVKLEHGYDEEVGEAGALLSVGQKQLISLARAILARPAIIVMDEATSSIDTLTEELIQKGMKRLLSSATSFVIAHRLSTIRSADRILVIEGGRIRELGTHKELLDLKGHYYQLYTKQFRTERSQTLGALG